MKEAADSGGGGPRLRLRTETKLIKAIARVFPEPRTPQDPAAIMRALAKGYELTLMDEAKIRAIRPNNQEGRRILSRFYNPEREMTWKNNPPNFLSAGPGPGKFGADLLIEVLKIFDCFTGCQDEYKKVIIEVRDAAPMVLKNDYFTVYVAPRIEQEERKDYEPIGV
jgi:hypothetical protein